MKHDLLEFHDLHVAELYGARNRSHHEVDLVITLGGMYVWTDERMDGWMGRVCVCLCGIPTHTQSKTQLSPGSIHARVVVQTKLH